MTEHNLREAAQCYLDETPTPRSRKGTEAWDALRAALAAPLAAPTLADTIRRDADRQAAEPIHAALIARASDLYYREGEIEIDDCTVTDQPEAAEILANGGAHVMAWVWVDIPTDDSDEPEEYGPAADRLIAAHKAELAEAASWAGEPEPIA